MTPQGPEPLRPAHAARSRHRHPRQPEPSHDLRRRRVRHDRRCTRLRRAVPRRRAPERDLQPTVPHRSVGAPSCDRPDPDTLTMVHPVDDRGQPPLLIAERHGVRGSRTRFPAFFGHAASAGVHRPMGDSALGHVVVRLPALIHPLEVEQPRTVDEFVQHPRREKTGLGRVFAHGRPGSVTSPSASGTKRPKPKWLWRPRQTGPVRGTSTSMRSIQTASEGESAGSHRLVR
ncbi:hypothetical protein PROPJV5_2371 [Propionibacterium ruminifibrarum]|uniref:Uncharacterized protein n=1 Tax=Propionibacterium ruminifibrarum TaxID=1962131 RepID=A0A375I3Y7_9ACTN|nr:hypothetical protein PROPJV5_2371 [Propionibacterium ruminifibrarum]